MDRHTSNIYEDEHGWPSLDAPVGGSSDPYLAQRKRPTY